MSVHFFGIRHHGPGCARSLKNALQQLRPDCILIEGPPEADELLSLAILDEMRPPVAILVYAPAMPQHAVYFPLAQFSPEWQAIIYGQASGVPTHFIDLPQSVQIAREISITEGEPQLHQHSESPEQNRTNKEQLRHDPLTYLAKASGFSDSDTWWDHLIEQRQDALDLFAAIEEMMTVVREGLNDPLDEKEALREAHMRQAIRQATKKDYQRIAVICGAWHVPALRKMPSAKADSELLKNQGKAKVTATWTPWTYGRLSQASGYGAGIAAPGWYHHCWDRPENAASFWLADAMRLLREKDLDASSAQLIEILRLADTLASLRDRTRAGLNELLEAMQSVMFGGQNSPMRLIQEALLVNDRLGSVPSQTPSLPLPLDVKEQQRRLRLPPKIEFIDLELDLRQAAHLEKSIFLHRLNLLGIDWGSKRRVAGKTGSFHEHWRLEWKVEYELKLIEANVWGSNLLQACEAKIKHQARHSKHLPELSALVQAMLLADIKGTAGILMEAIQELSTTINDAGVLLAALPDLAKVLRYGDTRGTDLNLVQLVFEGLVQRACIALPVAATGINTEAAQALVKQINEADQALTLLEQLPLLEVWRDALIQCNHESRHPLIAGRCVRILIDHTVYSEQQAADALSLACNNPINPLATAEWLEGFLQGSGLLLVMNDSLWSILNQWIAQLPETVFHELLPLMRRSFCHFEIGEKRQLGQKVATGQVQLRRGKTQSIEVDASRAKKILPIARLILLDDVATSS